MILRAFVQRFTRSAELMSLLVWVLVASGIANVLLAAKVLTSRERVVLLPPALTSEGAIGPSTASETVLSAWGLSVANLLGNVSPKTVPFVVETLQQIMVPASYQAITNELAAQARYLETEGLSLSFSPSTVHVDADARKVVVSGVLTTIGVRNQRRTEVRTYEMAFRVNNYIVQLETLTSYEGQPKKESSAP